MALLFLLCLIFASVLASKVNFEPPEEVSGKISISRCCPDNEFYTLATGMCKTQQFLYKWPPPVYSPRFNETILPSNLTNFELIETFESCINETSVFVISTDFKFFEDGTLLLPDGKGLKATEFCLNPVDIEGKFVACYCALDPCNDTNCVKKCCPDGMAINGTTHKCQSSSLEFKVDFKNESGNRVNPESFALRSGGHLLSCPHGMILLEPEMNEKDEFYILPDGRLYQPSNPEGDRYTSAYCVENLLLDSSSANLTALLCLMPEPERPYYVRLTNHFFPYLLFISSIFLIATFIVYAILSEIRNVHGATIMCHVASLSIMYIGLGIIKLENLIAFFPTEACVGLGVIVHFAFLSTYTWLNVMSFDIWWTFSRRKMSRRKMVARAFWKRTLGLNDERQVDDDDEHIGGGGYVTVTSTEEPTSSVWDLRPHKARNRSLTRRFIFYSLYAWGVPLTIVSTGQILEKKKRETGGDFVAPEFVVWCWFRDDLAYSAYVFGPVSVLILSNIVFFLMTASLFYRASVDAAFAANRIHAKQKLRVIFSLFILMGVSWTVEAISYFVGDVAYITLLPDIFNILTGVFIFIIFVCKPNVWKLLKVKFPCFERFDVWCPHYMKPPSTRQEALRVAKNETSPTNIKTDIGDDEVKGRLGSLIATSITQIEDLGDEISAYNDRY